MIRLFKALILKKTLVQGKYYRRNRLVTRSTCKIRLFTQSTRLTVRGTRSTCLLIRSTHLSTRSTRLSTRSICLSIRGTRLSTRSICLYARSTHSTICRSFYNRSLKNYTFKPIRRKQESQ